MEESRVRVVIEHLSPQIDGGRFPVKRIVGDSLTVQADIFADSHDELAAALLFRHEKDTEWAEHFMQLLVNDRWQGIFTVDKTGRYYYTVVSWVDRFRSAVAMMARKVKTRQPIDNELITCTELIGEAAQQANPEESQQMLQWIGLLNDTTLNNSAKLRLLTGKKINRLMQRYSPRKCATRYAKELEVTVDRKKARFSTWYEMFPRSCVTAKAKHGTFLSCLERLPYIAAMGFDVLYLPPVHPIGISYRKGKNNELKAAKDSPGSPWAIGAAEGGHKALHPDLGTLGDFKRLLKEAKRYGLEIALDIAFNCTPDHPYVKEHPEWFLIGADGTIRYAENPPKKYQDIYPLNFETENWRELWDELKSIILYWIEQGIFIFRIDNPHTKPFAFWEWLINEIKKDYPQVIFLAEAFTRPKVVHRLAKLGFSQSYTYFTWRNEAWEIKNYFNELTQSEVKEYFRPNLWPNTPDILTDYLSQGGPPAFKVRLVLAATLGASYGIYGPAFELCENKRRDTVSEEYLNSEKYEIKHWNIDSPNSIKDFIAVINRIRKENIALQDNAGLTFHETDNKQIICYSKAGLTGKNMILVIVNLDSQHRQSGWTELSLAALGLKETESFQVNDLLNGVTYRWQGKRNYVELDPQNTTAHIFSVIKED